MYLLIAMKIILTDISQLLTKKGYRSSIIYPAPITSLSHVVTQPAAAVQLAESWYRHPSVLSPSGRFIRTTLSACPSPVTPPVSVLLQSPPLFPAPLLFPPIPSSPPIPPSLQPISPLLLLTIPLSHPHASPAASLVGSVTGSYVGVNIVYLERTDGTDVLLNLSYVGLSNKDLK